MAQLCHETKSRHCSSSLQAMEVTAGHASNNRVSQSSTPAAAGKLSLPGKRINFALKCFFLYLTRSTATPALTPVIPKCLPWVGVFNEGFLSRPAFCQVQFICHVASFSLHPYYIYKLLSFRRVPRTLTIANLTNYKPNY